MADKERKLKWLLWADAVKFKQGLNQAKKDLGGFQKSAEGTFKNFASAMGAAISVAAIANFTKELTRLSGEVEGVATAFSKIASTGDLQSLRNSVKGTVTDLQLMKMAVSANTLGLPVQQLGNLFEFAAKMAQDTGQSVDYLVDSIVRGIGRKSALILDNLGISAIQLKEALGGISVEAASVGQVTEAVSKIAADYLRENGGLLDTNATKIQRITAEWDNFKASLAVSPTFTNAISELLTEIEMLVTGYATVWDLAKGIINEKGWDKLRERFAEWKQLKAWNEKYDGMYGEGESTQQKKTAQLIDKTTESTKRSKTAYEQLSDQLSELQKTQKAWATQNKDISDITARVAGVQLQIDKIDELIKKQTEAAMFKGKYGGTYTPSTSIAGLGASSVSGESSLDTKTLGDMSALIARNTEKVEGYYAEIQNLGIRAANAIQGTFENMVYGVSDAFASLASGTGTMADVVKALMMPVADLAISLGVILLGVGKGIEALKASLSTIQGPIAIIAGAALIALGTAAKAGVASLGSGGGGSYSGSSGSYDTRTFSASAQTYGLKANAMRVEVVGQTQIKNKDIYIAFKNAESSRKQNT